jgi:predicted metal-dependent hydrolase
MDADLEQAIATFNRGEYLAAAEAFEHSQVGADPNLKSLIGALNRIAAALHLRFERGGHRGAINLLAQALATLQDCEPNRAGVDIERLSAEVGAFAEELRTAPRDQSEGLKHRARIFIERRRAPKINRTV